MSPISSPMLLPNASPYDLDSFSRYGAEDGTCSRGRILVRACRVVLLVQGPHVYSPQSHLVLNLKGFAKRCGVHMIVAPLFWHVRKGWGAPFDMTTKVVVGRMFYNYQSSSFRCIAQSTAATTTPKCF
ncbi:hypothetical protein VNO80_17255 [Phaseolus coccineus]|uniref:Uncharacterized protein n=1 Tax=Phaseolus coccineus TaxID=3886 RepID=A0AAN9MT27_PHACN